MLYDKTGYLYKRTKSGTLRTYPSTPIATIQCNVQPITGSNGLDGGSILDGFIIYTTDMTVDTSDKISVDGTVYLVEMAKPWEGVFGQHVTCNCKASSGT